MDTARKAGWLSRPCHQEAPHGRWASGEHPLISLFGSPPSSGIAGQASPVEGWAGTSLISAGREETPRGRRPPAHQGASCSAWKCQLPAMADTGLELRGLRSPTHCHPWVLDRAHRQAAVKSFLPSPWLNPLGWFAIGLTRASGVLRRTSRKLNTRKVPPPIPAMFSKLYFTRKHI